MKVPTLSTWGRHALPEGHGDEAASQVASFVGLIPRYDSRPFREALPGELQAAKPLIFWGERRSKRGLPLLAHRWWR